MSGQSCVHTDDRVITVPALLPRNLHDVFGEIVASEDHVERPANITAAWRILISLA